MERISSQFISSLRNEKTPQKSNQKSKDIPRTPTSMSGRKSNRRNTISNHIVSSQPSKSNNSRQSDHLIIASRNVIQNSNNPFFHSEKKSVDSTQDEYLRQSNENKFKNTSVYFAKADTNPNIIHLTNKEGTFSLQDTSSLKYFEQNSQRQSNGSKLFSIPPNNKEEQNRATSRDQAFFLNKNNNSNTIALNKLKIEESCTSQTKFTKNNSRFSLKDKTNSEFSLNGVLNPDWRELRNRYKQQKAKSIEDQNRRYSVMLQQESALDKILQDNDNLRGNQRKQTSCSDQSSLQLIPKRHSFDVLLPDQNKQSQNEKDQTSFAFCSSQIFEQTLEKSIPRSKQSLENDDTFQDAFDPEENGKVPVNSLLDIGFLEEQQQATPNNIEGNLQLNVSSQTQQFASDNTTHIQSKDANSDMLISNCSEDYYNSISINKGLINSGFSDISPISSQIHIARKSSMNKDQSSHVLAVESRLKDHRFDNQNQNQLMYSDSSEDNFIHSLQTPDQARYSTILQIQQITGNVQAAEIPASSSIIAPNSTTTAASRETTFKTEIESPAIQQKLKNFLEEIGYYQDTEKTKQINKIMAEITLGLVIDKAKTSEQNESQSTIHEQIEAHHFDLLKKQVEILHALCKGEGDVETQISKKILNDVLCVSFGKKCIQTAFQNAIKRSRSMNQQNRTSFKKLSGTSTESSKNTITILEKDEEAAELKNTQSELEPAQSQKQNNNPILSPNLPRLNKENNSKVDTKQKGISEVPRKRRKPLRTESSESQKNIAEEEKQTSDSESESIHVIESNSNLSNGNKPAAKKSTNNKKLKK